MTVLFLVGIAVLPGTAAATEHGINECQTIDTAGEYEVNESFTGSGDPCLDITASDVVIDGNGTEVDIGHSGDNATAIAVRGDNVTIKNFTDTTPEREFGDFARVRGSDVTIKNNWYKQNYSGVQIVASSGPVQNITVDNNTFNSLDRPTVYAGVGSSDSVENVTIQNNELKNKGVVVDADRENALVDGVDFQHNDVSNADTTTIKASAGGAEVANVTIADSTFQFSDGVRLQTADADATLSNVAVDAVTFDSSSSTAVEVVADGTHEDVSVTDSEFTNTDGNAVFVVMADGAAVADGLTVSNVTIDATNDTAVSFTRAAGSAVTVQDAVVTDSFIKTDQNAVDVSEVPNVSVTDSELVGIGSSTLAVQAYDGTPNLTVDSVLVRGHSTAVRAGGSADASVTALDVEEVQPTNTTVSADLSGAAVSVANHPPDPMFDEMTPIGRYVRVDTESDGSISDLTIGYDDADVDSENESDLAVWVGDTGWEKFHDAPQDAQNDTLTVSSVPSEIDVAVGVFVDKTGTIKGEVRDTNGENLVAPARVQVNDPAFDRSAEFTTDDGEFRLAAPPTEYRVVADAPENTTAVEENVEVTSGNTTTETLSLPIAATIEGHVVDEAGTPIEDAFVLVDDGDKPHFNQTSADGSYKLEVPAGTHTPLGFYVDKEQSPPAQYASADPPTFNVSEGESLTDGNETNITLTEINVTNRELSIIEGPGEEENLTLATMQEAGFLVVQVKNDTDGEADPDTVGKPHDLTGANVTSNTTFEITMTAEGYDPDSLIWGIDNADMDVVENESGGVDITITGSAVHLSAVPGQPVGPIPANKDPTKIDWPDDNDQADPDTNFPNTTYFALMDNSLLPGEAGSSFEDARVTTNAQTFTAPQVTDDRLRVWVAGPSKLPDESEHDGFYEAFIPNSQLDEWGIDDPETELNVMFKGDEESFSVEETAEGAVIRLDIGYSEGYVDVEPDPQKSTSEETQTEEGEQQEEEESTSSSSSSSSSSSDSDDSTETEDVIDGTEEDVEDVTIDEANASVSESAVLADDAPDKEGLHVEFEETGTVDEIVFEEEDVSPTEMVTVKEAEDVPEQTPAPKGAHRKTVAVDAPSGVADSDATMRIRLDADEIETETSNVIVEKYQPSEDGWEELPTEVVEEDGDEVVIETETPGFSLFAVTERTSDDVAAESDTEETETGSDTPTPESTTDAETDGETTSTSPTPEPTQPGFTAAVVLSTLFGGAALVRRIVD